MISNKLKNIEEKIRNAEAMEQGNKDSVLELLDDLKKEIREINDDKAEQLSSMGSFAEAGANEATRTDGDEGILNIALSGVRASVKDFEESHPQLVQVINSICTQLSNSGL